MNKGYFGEYGGLFIPETLSHALTELENLYKKIKNDEGFKVVDFSLVNRGGNEYKGLRS